MAIPVPQQLSENHVNQFPNQVREIPDYDRNPKGLSYNNTEVEFLLHLYPTHYKDDEWPSPRNNQQRKSN